MSTPVRLLAWIPISGTPRCVAGMDVLPAGSASWKAGRANTWLKPPPEPTQPISRTPGVTWQFGGGETLSTPTPVGAFVHSYVPPTAVTRGSDAGHSTGGQGITAGFFTGVLRMFAVPKSPEEANTVTRVACAPWRACLRFSRAAVPWLNGPLA